MQTNWKTAQKFVYDTQLSLQMYEELMHDISILLHYFANLLNDFCSVSFSNFYFNHGYVGHTHAHFMTKVILRRN